MARALAVFGVQSWLVLSVLLGTACGSSDEPEHDHTDGHHDADSGHSHNEAVGPSSGAECPNGSDLTYGNFAEQFFADYCLRCHSNGVTGNARMGAPSDHNFDTLAEIDLVHDHVDQLAAFGPDSQNEKMPPSGMKPTDDERKKLGEWLACGLAE